MARPRVRPFRLEKHPDITELIEGLHGYWDMDAQRLKDEGFYNGCRRVKELALMKIFRHFGIRSIAIRAALRHPEIGLADAKDPERARRLFRRVGRRDPEIARKLLSPQFKKAMDDVALACSARYNGEGYVDKTIRHTLVDALKFKAKILQHYDNALREAGLHPYEKPKGKK